MRIITFYVWKINDLILYLEFFYLRSWKICNLNLGFLIYFFLKKCFVYILIRIHMVNFVNIYIYIWKLWIPYQKNGYFLYYKLATLPTYSKIYWEFFTFFFFLRFQRIYVILKKISRINFFFFFLRNILS